MSQTPLDIYLLYISCNDGYTVLTVLSIDENICARSSHINNLEEESFQEFPGKGKHFLGKRAARFNRLDLMITLKQPSRKQKEYNKQLKVIQCRERICFEYLEVVVPSMCMRQSQQFQTR